MKKDDTLQHSELLAKFFAPRREEAPILSVPEIEKRLAEQDMLQNNHITINNRKIIMSLSALTGIAAIVYFAFFNSPSVTHRTNLSNGIYRSPSASAEATPEQASTTIPEKPFHASAAPRDTRGPWSAGNDQIYADLTPEELAKLGITFNDDTVENYRLDSKDNLGVGKVTFHYIASFDRTTTVPTGIEPHHFFPELITFANGNGAAWETSNAAGMIASEVNTLLLPWLKKPGTPGYRALGFWNHVSWNGTGSDTLRLMIGKDFSMPAPMPFQWMTIDPHWDSVQSLVMQLAHYYEGTASKPAFELPKRLVLAVDTMTPQSLLDTIAHDENSSMMEHLHSIMARLNELVPVIVRPHGGSGAPDTSDFIFWYEPSDELFAALPPMQAKMFEQKKSPECMEAPEAVISSAQITYCVSEPQSVEVNVFDLSGHEILSQMAQAVAGDNTATVDTRSLQSGMYIILVREQDGSQRTRRIWVQNAR